MERPGSVTGWAPRSFWAAWSYQVGIRVRASFLSLPRSPPRVLLERTCLSESGCIGPWCSLTWTKGGQSGPQACGLHPHPQGCTMTQVVLSSAFPQPNSSLKGEPAQASRACPIPTS